MISLLKLDPDTIISADRSERKLVWVQKFGMWRQVPLSVARKEKLTCLDLEGPYVPSVQYMIELLRRMSDEDRQRVIAEVTSGIK